MFICFTFLDYFNLPKLRKENPYLESPENTSFQIFLIDFLYAQQDLYGYYEKQYKELVNGKKTLKPLEELQIKIKSLKLPFKSLLVELPRIISDIEKSKLIEEFHDLRWYQIDNRGSTFTVGNTKDTQKYSCF